MFEFCGKCLARFTSDRHVCLNHDFSPLLSEDHQCAEVQEHEESCREEILPASISDVELEDFECSSSNEKKLVCNLCDKECGSYEDLKFHYREHAFEPHKEELCNSAADNIERLQENSEYSCLPEELCNSTNCLVRLEDIDSVFTVNPIAEEMTTNVTLPKVTLGCAESAAKYYTTSRHSQVNVDEFITSENNIKSGVFAEECASLYECEASTSSGIISLPPTEKESAAEVGRNGKRILPFAKGSKEWKDYKNAQAKEYRNLREDLCCPLCSYTAKYSSKIKFHLDTVHQRGRFHCPYCSESLDSVLEKRKHVASRHPLVHECEQCGYQSKIKSYVDKHIRITHMAVIKCTIPGCNEAVSKYKLRAHLMNKHFSYSTECSTIVVDRLCEGYFQCPHCEHKEKSSCDIEDHIEKVHTSGIRCPFDCSSSFPLEDLDMHIRTMHADERLCTVAPRVVTRRMGNNVEERMSCSVSYMTPTETSIAESTITSQSIGEDNLDTNDSEYESHSDDRSDDDYIPPKEHILGSLVCSYCSKTFKENYRLRKHVASVHLNTLVRSRPKKHSCPVSGCDKSFTAATLLQDHISAHQGIAAYNCAHCNQSFAARARFAVHLRRYHSMSIKTYDQLNRALARNTTAAQTSTTRVAHPSGSTTGRLTNFLNNTVNKS